jgi:hypothetical protein
MEFLMNNSWVDLRLFDSAVATAEVSVRFYKMIAFSGILMIGEEMCVSFFNKLRIGYFNYLSAMRPGIKAL